MQPLGLATSPPAMIRALMPVAASGDREADLSKVPTPQLEALANYFEAQAERLRMAANENRRRERAAEVTRTQRADAKAKWLDLGCRSHVLRTRGLEWSQIAARLLCTHHVARVACGEWRRKKKARRLAKRDREIYRLTVQGIKRDEIAKRHRITARQVRTIASAVSHALAGTSLKGQR